MRKKIFLGAIVFLFVLFIFNHVHGYETEKYIEDDDILQIIAYNTDKVIKEFEKKGYTQINATPYISCDGYSNAKTNCIAQINKELGTYSKSKDNYETDWYLGSNKLEKVKDPGSSQVGSLMSIRKFLQWTYNDKMYIAWIYLNTKTSTTCTLLVFTNNNINEELEILASNDAINELKNAYTNAEPSENDSYTVVANWVYSDSTYNSSKQLKELAKTDEGIKKMQVWETELSKHIRGGSDDTSVVYLARTILQDLIEADKDPDAIDDATNKNKQHGENVMLTILKNLQGEDRDQELFTDDVLEDIDAYDPSKHELDTSSTSKIENVTSKILTVISNIGIAVSVIMLAALGIKYMLGSVEEKAEYKEGLIPYVVGAFILFGITGFIKILLAIGDRIGNI